ncbi:MAG: hypothetical protein K5873_00145 [Treponema sp.]|nr:hypothetical protein [Treponema sp.]
MRINFRSLLFSFSTLVFLSIPLNLNSEKYQISEINYSLEKTRERDLRRTVPVDTEKIFQSKEELDSFLKDLKQRLINTRAFQTIEISEFNDSQPQESTSAEIHETSALQNPSVSDDKTIKISLTIDAKDSKHLMIMPYPKYDSNDGLIFKIKLKDVNFIGSMNTLNAGLYAGIKEDTSSGDQNFTCGLEFDYSYPFQAGPFNSSWNNNFILNYTSGVRELEFWSGSGLTFELPYRRFSLVLDVSQHANRDLEYEEFDDVTYFSSQASFSIPVKILDIKNWGFLFWTPSTKLKYNYDYNGIHINNDDLAGPVLSAEETLSTSRINWYGNFRHGLSLKIGHSYGYDFQQNEWDPRFFGELQVFKAFKYGGINSRFTFLLTDSNREKFGKLIRGVRDKQLYANSNHLALKTPSALVLNLDFPLHIVNTRWLDWMNLIFGQDSWLTKTFAWTDKFNFELQLSPFIDVALTKNEITDRLYAFEDGWYTGGIELLLFFENWKGIVMRTSFGLDLGRLLISEKFPESLDMSWRNNVKSYEIYAGIGLHY